MHKTEFRQPAPLHVSDVVDVFVGQQECVASSQIDRRQGSVNVKAQRIAFAARCCLPAKTFHEMSLKRLWDKREQLLIT